MDRYLIPISKHCVLLTYSGILLLTCAGLAGCRGDATVGASDESTARASQESEADCLDFQGFTHCPLGAAGLVPDDRGTALGVTS